MKSKKSWNRTLVVLFFATWALTFVGTVASAAGIPTATSSNVGPFLVTAASGYIDFSGLCAQYVTGFSNDNNLIGNPIGNCAGVSNPLIISASHENLSNSHSGAANYSPTRFTYMNDFLLSNLGQWINDGFYPGPSGSNSFGLSLDTVTYQNATNPLTGWPLTYGHLFFGLNDTSVVTSLDHNLYVEFDIRIRGDYVGPVHPQNSTAAFPDGYSGHHITLGTSASWAGKDHFLEIVLYETPGYSQTYGDPSMTNLHCQDATYLRCWDNGNEGKYLSYSSYLQQPTLPLNTDGWTHVKIPLSDILRSLSWDPAPTDWSTAILGGLYVGVESMGQTWSWAEIQNYRVYTADPAPSTVGLPLGLVRQGAAGYLSTPQGVCALSSSTELNQYSFTQNDYDVAPQVALPAGYMPAACPWPSTAGYSGLFRVGNGSYRQTAQFYCGISSPQQMLSFGYTQQQYSLSPQVFIPDNNLIYTGACR